MSIRVVPTVEKAAHTPEQIVQKLREVEKIATSEGVAIAELECENARLRCLLAEKELCNSILREVEQGTH